MMKKLQLIPLLTIVSFTTVFSQEDCAELNIELKNKETQISKQQDNIVKQQEIIGQLEQDVAYYKKTLDLLNSKISTKTKDVTFKITSAKGDANTAEILVEGLMINNGGLRSMQIYRAEAFDPKGNSLKYGAMAIGLTKRVAKLFNDVPVKFTTILKGAEEGTPMIKSLMIEFLSKKTGPQEKLIVAFKNIPVEWM